MDKIYSNLIDDFKSICKKRWIKGVTSGHGNVGLTFEKLLGKDVDSDYSPDYNGIELKCTTRFSNYPVSLFSIAFDGPTDKEIIRINQLYGYFDSTIPNKKVILKSLKYNQITELRSGYSLSFDIDYIDKKLYLCVYDFDKNLIEREAFVYLDTIKEHLLKKLKKLAIIKASKKIIDNDEFFRYYSIDIYELKSFDVFFEMLKKGEIKICIIARVNNNGVYHNKNLVFQINKSNIDKLFNCVYSYNLDDIKNENFIFLTI